MGYVVSTARSIIRLSSFNTEAPAALFSPKLSLLYLALVDYGPLLYFAKKRWTMLV